MSYNKATLEYGVKIFYGCTRILAETLTKDAVENRTHWFANNSATPSASYAPISTRDLRLKGYIGADWEFVVNFTLEPLTGRLDCAAALPEYDSIVADYNYFEETYVKILTTDFKVNFPLLSSDVDIYGQPHYTVHANYPSDVSFKFVLRDELWRNYLTEATLRSCYFLLIDEGIPETYGIRAFEGPIWSDEQGSLYKGASPFLPIKLLVQQFGLYSLEDQGSITAKSNYLGGGVWTQITSTGHGLSTDDWVVISGCTEPAYNGTWKIIKVDANNFRIHVTYTATSSTGIWNYPANIAWGFFAAST